MKFDDIHKFNEDDNLVDNLIHDFVIHIDNESEYSNHKKGSIRLKKVDASRSA